MRVELEPTMPWSFNSFFIHVSYYLINKENLNPKKICLLFESNGRPNTASPRLTLSQLTLFRYQVTDILENTLD